MDRHLISQVSRASGLLETAARPVRAKIVAEISCFCAQRGFSRAVDRAPARSPRLRNALQNHSHRKAEIAVKLALVRLIPTQIILLFTNLEERTNTELDQMEKHSAPHRDLNQGLPNACNCRML